MFAATSVMLLAGLMGAVGLQTQTGEGQDFLLELADSVLANKQALLYVPYKIEKARDVGYVGELPTLANATCQVKMASLGTGRELQGFPPDVAIGTLEMKDSGLPAIPPSAYRYGGSAGGDEVRHLNGVAIPPVDLVVWQWQRQRHIALKEWLAHWVSRVPTKLAVIHSNGDVLFGGCDENTIEFKYQEIISASGGTAKIVAAAEVSPYPSDLGMWYESKAWTNTARTSMLTTFGRSADWITKYANCTGAKNSLCTSPPKYQYASSGVLVGPVVDLYNMFASMYTYTGEENRIVNEYYLKNPSLMTLDYAGIMSMSLNNLVKGGSIPVEVSGSGSSKSLVNKEGGEKVCFVHGNGNSFGALKTLAQQLKDA